MLDYLQIKYGADILTSKILIFTHKRKGVFMSACCLQMEARDYNPVLHERGFHQKLNVLVKESLQFG